MNYKRVRKKELNHLLNKWDPIGVGPFSGGPKDEYECFVRPIFSLLSDGKEKSDIVAFLKKHLKHHIGINPEGRGVDQFAEKILIWWKRESSFA